MLIAVLRNSLKQYCRNLTCFNAWILLHDMILQIITTYVESAVENHTITSCFTLSMQSIGNCHKYLVYFVPMACASNCSFSQYLISVVKSSSTRTVKFYLKHGNNTACLQINVREY